MNKIIKRKLTGMLFIIGSLIYLLAEYVAISNSPISLNAAYLNYPIGLFKTPFNQIYMGMINSFSPMHSLLNIAFIIFGIITFISFNLEINKRINSNKILYYPLLIITSLGFILLGITSTSAINNYQLAIAMALLCGNIFLIVLGKTINTNNLHRIVSLTLGTIGVITFVIMTYALISNNLLFYLGLFERISLYAIILWNISTGIYLITQ